MAEIEDLVAGLQPRPPKLWATRLIASVVPRTKTISRGRARAEEALHLAARALEGRRRALAQLVHAAVDVGVVVLVVARHGVDHRAGLLGGGGVVEVDERPAVDPLGQDREVRAQAFTSSGDRGLAGGAGTALMAASRARARAVVECRRAPLPRSWAGPIAQHRSGESADEDGGPAPRDAARAQVEERPRSSWPDRGAVAALHVVGVDLELGLGVDLRVRRDSSRFRLVCRASIFWAPGRTTTLPLKTPRPRPATMPL